MKPRQFVDSVKVYVAGGDGGNGCCSFRREKYIPKGGPDGGDGGHGGHVILRTDPHTDFLTHLAYAPHQRASRGQHGKGKQMHGRNGPDLIVNVPLGTEVWDVETQKQIGDLIEAGEELIVARGGKGGLGNPHWQTSTHQTPYECTPGVPGEKRTVRLELKLVAQFALVGFPNAGKSSLLRGITHAHPKVASYPFTTRFPVIGTVECEDYTQITVADIPGIMKGAHDGIGLGDRFLRHIERAPFLIFVIDMAGTEGRDPADDYRILRQELELYRHELLQRAVLIVANKMDLPAAAGNLMEFRKITQTDPLAVSAASGEGIEGLKQALCRQVHWQTG